LASFSSRGPIQGRIKPDIAAPGANIISCAGSGNSYRSASGTSMAAPTVAGAFALLWSAVPELKRDVQRTAEIFFKSAVPQQTTECQSKGIPNNLFGWGSLNVEKAIEIARREFGYKN
jgi:subtilisin family serine protease